MHNPFEQLDKSRFSFENKHPLIEKQSQKPLDIFSRQILENAPDLRKRISETLQILEQHNSEMPLIHITSREIKRNNEVVSTGFIENIKQRGFKARHTNVGSFIERGAKSQIAQPNYFITNPEELIKDLYTILQRYGHHGIRTNKEALVENRNAEEAIPTLLLIDGNTHLDKGTDYDDHYLLAEDLSGDRILGDIDLNLYKPYREHLADLLDAMLTCIKKYYSK